MFLNSWQKYNRLLGFVLAFLSSLISGCNLPMPEVNQENSQRESPNASSRNTIQITPTPDPMRVLPTMRAETIQYSIQPKDTLSQIAQHHQIDLNSLIEANQIDNPDLLEIGQVLIIPPPVPLDTGPSFKIIPDSELVFGPASVDIDVSDFIQQHSGYLNQHSEDVGGRIISGPEIIARIAREFSVNPRLLIALLEFRSGWVTQSLVSENTIQYPIAYINTEYQGLYKQLAWAANNINRGYYLWRVNAISNWVLADGSVIPVDATINAGTAGIQHLMGLLLGYDEWLAAVTSNGISATYQDLFGYPFDLAIEPLLPNNLIQPPMQLPFEPGITWSFTGGPHGGWGDGSGWAALDFAPLSNEVGCISSDAWAVAMVDGLVVRAGDGVVIQDLDGDGFEQTGWTILYLHIESRERVSQDAYLRRGERIGHPSCEGGTSSGTHIHIARRYNGEWIPADGTLPFDLDGWISEGTGIEYEGYLKRNGQIIKAWNGRKTENQIHR